MIFICDYEKFAVLRQAAAVIEVDAPVMKSHLEIDDTRLITIAQTLGMEELRRVISNEEAMQRLGISDSEPPVEVYVVGSDQPIILGSPAPEDKSDIPACEICGKPVKSRRAKICSAACRAEKARRYAREYQQRKKAEDAGGGIDDPLSDREDAIHLPDWGSDPGDEPVLAGGR